MRNKLISAAFSLSLIVETSSALAGSPSSVISSPDATERAAAGRSDLPIPVDSQADDVLPARPPNTQRPAATQRELNGTSAPRPGVASSKRVSESPQPRRPGSADDETRYHALEQSSPGAARYEGGDTVVIGATTATIVLAILLLVVLI